MCRYKKRCNAHDADNKYANNPGVHYAPHSQPYPWPVAALAIDSLANRPHMIAVGGAGSSGRPALASGISTITATRIAKAVMAMNPLSPMAN